MTAIGSEVWVKCSYTSKVNVSRVKRTVVEIKDVGSNKFYGVVIGHGSNGKAIRHWYPEARITPIETKVAKPVKQPVVSCMALMIRPPVAIIIIGA